MTLPVSAAFGPWMRSKNGGLSMIIGAVSFCKTPSNEERPVRSWARQGYDWQLNADNSSGGRTRWSSCIPAFTSTRAQWVTQPQFLRRRNNGLSPHDSDPANPPSLRCARARCFWRRGRDSNSRSDCSDAGFQDRCIQPLCHLSGFVQIDYLLLALIMGSERPALPFLFPASQGCSVDSARCHRPDENSVRMQYLFRLSQGWCKCREPGPLHALRK
jgi:hypothetical protein